MSAAAGPDGGTPLKILFQILGINEAKTAITSLTPEITKVETAAGTAGQKITAMVKPLEDAGAAGAKLTPIAQNMDKTKTSSEGAATSVTKVAGSLDKSRSSSDGASSSIQKYTGEGKKAASTTDDLSKSIDDSSSSSRKSSESHNALASATGKVSSESSKTSKSVDALGNVNEKLGSTARGVSGGLNEQTNVLQKVGSGHQQAAAAADKNSASNTSLKSAFAATMGSAVALGGGLIGLFQNFESLERAQLKVDKSNNAVTASHMKVAALQEKLNKLTEQGKVGTLEYAQVQEKLSLALSKQSVVEETANLKQTDLNETQAEFYKEIIPNVMEVLGSFTSLIANSKDTVDAFREGLKFLGVEEIKLSSIMKFMSLSNPFFLALTIGAGIVTAFATNLFGFRDAINGVGVALGNAVEPLKPFLSLIGGLGREVVDFLGMGGDAAKAFGESTDEGMGAATEAVGGTEKAFIHWGQQQDSILKNADGSIAGYTSDFIKNIDESGKAMPGLSTAVGTAATESNKSFQKMVADAITTSAALKKEFSAAFDLQGIKISGLPTGTPHPQKLGTGTGELEDKPLGGGVKGMVSDLNLQVVSDGAGKLIGNLNALAAALKALHATSAQEAVVWDTLTNKMNITFYATDKNINGTNDLDETLKKLQSPLTSTAEKNAILGQSNTLVTGTTSALDQELQKHAGISNDAADATEKQTVGQKKLSDMFGSQRADLDAYNEILGNQAMMTELATAGMMKQDLAMKQGEVDVVANTAASARYSEQLNTMEGASLEVSKGLLKENDALNEAKAAMYQNIGTFAVLSDATKMADAQNVAFTDGYYKQAIATKQAEIALFGTLGTIVRLREEYTSGEGRILAYNTAEAEQAVVFEKDRLKADALRGTIAALNEEGASGQAQVVAFNNAYFEQELAFTQSKTKADALRATVAAMQAEYDVASVIAYTSAFQDQNKKFEDNRLAVDGMVGTILSLQSHYDDGRASQLAFTQGTREAEIAFINSKTAVDELEGGIADLILHLNDGNVQVVSFNKGMYDQRKSTLDAYLGISSLTGGVREYHLAVLNGLPQTTAFSTAIQNTKNAEDDMKVATAALLGDIKALTSQLTNSDSAITRYNNGFATGYKSILEWATGVAKARGEASGAMSAFDDFAGMLGEKLPEGYNVSLDAQKKFVEAMAGVPDEVQSVIDDMGSKGEELASSLADAFSKGKEGVEGAFDGLGEKVGFEIDDEIKDGLNASIIGAQLKTKLDEGFKLMLNTDFARNPGAFQKVANGVIGGIADAIAHDPKLATMGQPIIDVIEKMKLNPANSQLWIQLDKLLANFKTNSGAAATVQQQFIASLKDPSGVQGMQQNLGTAEQALANYQKAIAASQKTVEQYQALLGHMWDNAGKPAGAGEFDFGTSALDKVKGITGEDLNKKAGGGAPDTTGIDTAMAKLNEFKTQMGELPNLVNAAVTQINTVFTTMGTTFGTTVTTMGTVAKAGATLIGIALATGFQQAAILANTSMVTINSGATAMANAMKAVGNIAGISIATGFQQAERFAGTSMQSILRTAQTMANGMKSAATVAGGAIATGFQQGEKYANTSLQAILRMAVASGNQMKSTFASVAQAVASSFSNMQSRAASTFSSIVSSANRATSAVKQLASAINSLRDKTVTLTTVHRDVYQTSYAARGFGPSIVSSAMNMTVGEAGPELVSVIPLSSTNSSGMAGNIPSSLTNNRVTNSLQQQNTGITNMFGGGATNTSNINNNMSQQSSVLNRFSESVSKITTAFNRQESMMNSATNNTMIQNASTVGNTNISRGGGLTNTITNLNNGTAGGIPNISTVRGGGGIGTGGNGDLGSLVGVIKEMVLAAFGQTTINLNNTTTIDTEKVYEAQKKQFGLRNGSMFK